MMLLSRRRIEGEGAWREFLVSADTLNVQEQRAVVALAGA